MHVLINRDGFLKRVLIGMGHFLLFFTLLNGCASTAKSEDMAFGGWVTYWDFERGMSSLQKADTLLQDVYFFVAALDSQGTPFWVKEDLPFSVEIARIRTLGGVPWMTVVNDVHAGTEGSYVLKDSEVVHALLENHEKRKKHRQEIVRLAVEKGFLGVDIDYENLLAEDRDLFTLFIQELSEDLKKEGIQLSVTVQPKKGPSRGVGSGAADWAELCKTADRLQIMLYNLHNGKTDPGPMATLTWIQEIWRYARKECADEKIVPVLKVSGMLWGSDEVKGIHFQDAELLAREHGVEIQRHLDGQSPYFSYTVGEKRYTAYYEDSLSLREKVSLLKSLNCRRILFWSFGKQDPALLPDLQALSF